MALTSKALKTFVSNNVDIRVLQSNVSDALTPVLKTELIDGRLFTNLSIGTVATAINHGLSRKANGYIVVSSSNPAVFSDNISYADQTSFNLTASVATTVALWVF